MAAKHERPFLYVLATQPSTPNQAATSEWIIEIYKPQPTGLKPLSTVTHPKYSKHHLLSSLKSHVKHEHTSSPDTSATSTAAAGPATPAAAATTPQSSSEPRRIFFSRLHPQPSTSSASIGTNLPVILRIAVASIPYQHSHQITSDLETECTQALETVHTTPDPASWLRQALLALQGKAVLPPVSHDFDVTKFLTVAEEHLNRVLRTASTTVDSDDERAPRPPKEVKYWKLLRGEGGDLDDTDQDGKGEEADDEDEEVEGAHGANVANDWSLPHRERKSVSERGAGSSGASGFWISHGPNADRKASGQRQETGRAPWERKNNAYGGLM